MVLAGIQVLLPGGIGVQASIIYCSADQSFFSSSLLNLVLVFETVNHS